MLMNPAGFEPATSISAESRSLPLSYGFKMWRKVWELNPQEFSNSDGFQDRLACQMPNLPDSAGATRVEGIASYATPADDLLVHAVGLEPTTSPE